MSTHDHWDHYAACRGQDDLMLSDNAADQREAKKLCTGCDVREQCLTAAQAEEGAAAAKERAGVRGGLSPQQRYSAYRRDVRSTRTDRKATGQAKGRRTLSAEEVEQLDAMLRAGKPTSEIRAALDISTDTVGDHRRKLGLPAPARPLKPCGTYAAYNRHTSRGETPCDRCRAANNLYYASGGTVTALPDVELTA